MISVAITAPPDLAPVPLASLSSPLPHLHLQELASVSAVAPLTFLCERSLVFAFHALPQAASYCPRVFPWSSPLVFSILMSQGGVFLFAIPGT